MKISRQVGTTNEVLSVFVNDVTVSTGAGLANIVASSVSFSWCRNNQAAISSGTCTTGTLGTYGVSSFVQASSTSSLGWYQFSPPDGLFTSGRSAFAHLYGAPNMVPVPLEVELTGWDNQTALSAQAVSTVSGGVRVSSTVTVGVSSIVTVGVSSLGGITVGVSSNTDKTGYSGTVNVSALAANVFVSSAVSSDALQHATISTVKSEVRASSGVVNTSAFALPVGVSNFAGITVGVSSNTDKSGYTVTGGVGVSSFALPVGVSTAVLLDATYGAAGAISTNIAFINGVAVIGTGVSSDLWRA